MVKQLSNPPRFNGISKIKVIIFIGVIVIVLFVITIGGILNDELSNDVADEVVINKHVQMNKQTQQVLEKARQQSNFNTKESVVVPIIKTPVVDLGIDNSITQKINEEKYISKRAKTVMYIKDIHPNSSSAAKQFSMQDESNSTSSQMILEDKIKYKSSPYILQAGSVIPSIMITGINSDLSGIVTAMVRQNVYDSVSRKYLLIPQGSKLIGKYDSNIVYGQERLIVAWTRLIYPNGNSITLDAIPGSDIAGYSGFHDQVDNKYWKIFGSSFIMGVITASMQYSQNNTNPNVQVGGIGITNNDPTLGQTIAGSLGQQMGQTGMMVTQKNLNIQPTLIIRPHYPFNIILTADLLLKPY